MLSSQAISDDLHESSSHVVFLCQQILVTIQRSVLGKKLGEKRECRMLVDIISN